MHFFLVFIGLIFLASGGAAQAKVFITVDKDVQEMTVAVDDVEVYHWPVSTGNPSHETPNGSFRTFRMEEDHYSREFDDAPMPHSIFFTKVGHAIHGTDSGSRLGTPVSHGCVRLSRENASTLYALVESEGVLNTTVTLTGSSQVALARNPPAAAAPASKRAASRRIAPQVRAEAVYIYPAQRGYRRVYYPPGYYQPQGYAPQFYAPRQYYQQY